MRASFFRSSNRCFLAEPSGQPSCLLLPPSNTLLASFRLHRCGAAPCRDHSICQTNTSLRFVVRTSYVKIYRQLPKLRRQTDKWKCTQVLNVTRRRKTVSPQTAKGCPQNQVASAYTSALSRRSSFVLEWLGSDFPRCRRPAQKFVGSPTSQRLWHGYVRLKHATAHIQLQHVTTISVTLTVNNETRPCHT